MEGPVTESRWGRKPVNLLITSKVSLLIAGLVQSFLFAGCEKQVKLQAKDLRSLQEKRRFVQTISPRVEAFSERVPFVGVFVPSKMISLHFGVSGRLKGCNVRNGDLVKKGQVICVLDSTVVDIELERAKAGVEAAEKILGSNFIEKQQELFDAGVIGQGDFEAIRVQHETGLAELQDARNLLKLAQKKKAEHALRAPWPGRVSGLSFSQGQLVDPSVSLGFLSSSQALRLEVQLHASWYGRMRNGVPASIESLAGKRLPEALAATIAMVSGSIQPESQMFKVWLDVADIAGLADSIASGMLARGFVSRPLTNKGIVIPASTLIRWNSDNTAELFVVGEDERLSLKQVRVLSYSEDRVLIDSGLAPDDQIVRRFSADLYAGLPVRTLEKRGKGVEKELEKAKEPRVEPDSKVTK